MLAINGQFGRRLRQHGYGHTQKLRKGAWARTHAPLIARMAEYDLLGKKLETFAMFTLGVGI
jgi:hypothetical protein